MQKRIHNPTFALEYAPAARHGRMECMSGHPTSTPGAKAGKH